MQKRSCKENHTEKVLVSKKQSPVFIDKWCGRYYEEILLKKILPCEKGVAL